MLCSVSYTCILHYIAYCVNLYISQDRVPTPTDDKQTISVHSKNPAAGQVQLALQPVGGTVLLSGVRMISPVCRRRKQGYKEGFWLSLLATHRSHFKFSVFHLSVC